MLAGSHAYLVGPLIAFGLIGVLALALWWAFGRDADPLAGVHAAPGRELAHRERRDGHQQSSGHGQTAPPPDEDYGLLRPALVAEDLTGAGAVRARLAEAGIRATLSTGLDGRTRVLVFAEELDRARRLVGPPG
jgi:hypothetical protein